LASCHLLLYAVYTCQKLCNFINAFACYKQKCKLTPFNLAHPVQICRASKGYDILTQISRKSYETELYLQWRTNCKSYRTVQLSIPNLDLKRTPLLDVECLRNDTKETRGYHWPLTQSDTCMAYWIVSSSLTLIDLQGHFKAANYKRFYWLYIKYTA